MGWGGGIHMAEESLVVKNAVDFRLFVWFKVVACMENW